MKRLNNKGFAISTLLYGSVIIIFLLVIGIMSTLGTARKNTKSLSYVIDDELNRYSAINQEFEYDEEIDKYGREIFILEDGWYMINLWDTKVKFTGAAYFKKDDKINVYLKDKSDEESSYITFPSKDEVGKDEELTIKHFSAVRYVSDLKERSKFTIAKISDSEPNPLSVNTSTKLNNIRYIKDCGEKSSKDNWMIWTELRVFDDQNNDITSKGTLSFEPTTNIDDNNADKNKIIDKFFDKQDSGDYYGIKNKSGSDSEKCVILTLDKAYNLSEIAVWHYHDDFRSYKSHKIYVKGATGGYSLILNGPEKKETLLGIRYADRYNLH